MQRPLVLAILDGWGYRAEREANAIAQARKPNYDKLLREFPNTLLHASDHFVGLPDGQMGNSEVGHLNIGAGRVVSMDITRIDAMIANGSFYEHPEIVRAIDRACEGGRQLHLLGLVSDGGVHSQQKHLHALLRVAKMRGAERVYVHAFLDGRDTLPTSGAGYLESLERAMQEIGVGRLATVSGRYYAMDRDRRWERERLTFDAMVKGTAEAGVHSDAIARVKQSYSQSVTDEFVVPFVVADAAGTPVARVRDEDVCICFNYRADRVRQITRVLARESGLTASGGRELPGAEDLDKTIPRFEVPKNLHYLSMTQYDKQFKVPMILLPESMENLLANRLADAQLRNLRVAETEKYAHVTYFFNGGIEKEFPGEDRQMVPSQKVATYDLAPEMSARGIADIVTNAVVRYGLPVDRSELRECRYGRAFGQTGANHPWRGDCGRVPGSALHCAAAGRWIDADHRGPWQRGAAGGSGHWRTAHGSHHQPGAARAGERGRGKVPAARRWFAARHLPDRAGNARAQSACGDEWGRSSPKAIKSDAICAFDSLR